MGYAKKKAKDAAPPPQAVGKATEEELEELKANEEKTRQDKVLGLRFRVSGFSA